ERQRLAGGPVDLDRQRPQARLLARERGDAHVVDAVAGHLLELRAHEPARRALRLAARSRRIIGLDRVRVQLGDAVRAAAQSAERLVARELAEELHRDRGGHEHGDDDARQEEERQPDPEGPEHALSVAYADAASLCASRAGATL